MTTPRVAFLTSFPMNLVPVTNPTPILPPFLYAVGTFHEPSLAETQYLVDANLVVERSDDVNLARRWHTKSLSRLTLPSTGLLHFFLCARPCHKDAIKECRHHVQGCQAATYLYRHLVKMNHFVYRTSSDGPEQHEHATLIRYKRACCATPPSWRPFLCRANTGCFVNKVGRRSQCNHSNTTRF